MMEYIFESRYRHFACINLESITIVILSMVPVVGLEPTRPRRQQILSLPRLPIPTYRRLQMVLYIKAIDKSSFIFDND